RCLHWVPKDIAKREHVCPNCGEEIPRDHNSALLIKRLGIQSRPPTDSGSSSAEQGPLPSLREMVSPSVEAGSPRLSRGRMSQPLIRSLPQNGVARWSCGGPTEAFVDSIKLTVWS